MDAYDAQVRTDMGPLDDPENAEHIAEAQKAQAKERARKIKELQGLIPDDVAAIAGPTEEIPEDVDERPKLMSAHTFNIVRDPEMPGTSPLGTRVYMDGIQLRHVVSVNVDRRVDRINRVALVFNANIGPDEAPDERRCGCGAKIELVRG